MSDFVSPTVPPGPIPRIAHSTPGDRRSASLVEAPASPVRLARTPGRAWRVPEADVRAFLRARVRPGAWGLESPSRGFSAGGCVIARHAEGVAVAVRLGMDAAPVRLLAAAGLTPAVVAAGRRRGLPMHAQVLVEGRHPDRAWYESHLPDVAALLRRLTELAAISELLSMPADESYAAALWRYHRACRAVLDRLPAEAAYRGLWSRCSRRWP